MQIHGPQEAGFLKPPRGFGTPGLREHLATECSESGARVLSTSAVEMGF